MTRIYLIRHAESIANAKGIYQGQSYDSDLSPLGIKQAEALRQRFSNIPLDAIYSSPLRRTMQTARAIHAHHPNLRIETIRDLMETNHGEWEGKSKQEIEQHWPELYHLWQTTPSIVQFPGGEHFQETARRVISWFKSAMTTDMTMAVVTHVNVIQILIAHIHGLPLDELRKFSVGSTAVTQVESHSPARIIFINDTTHVIDLASDLSKQAL